MAEIIDNEASLQQMREQQRAAMAKMGQTQQGKNGFDQQLKAALASNTNLKNNAVAGGSSVAASSVLANVVKSKGSETKSTKSSSSSSSSKSSKSSSKSKKSKGGTPSGVASTSSGLSAGGANTINGSLSSSNSVGGVSSNTVGGANTTSTTDAALTGSGGGSSQQLMAATQQMQEMNQTFNLQYLNLQEGMQAENRQYSAVSNVMKTKQDTAKNSLSNLK